jgi:hypothetical protein
MDFLSIAGVLSDLPSTFTRIGAPYNQFIDSTITGLARYTQGADGVEAQVAGFAYPVDGWLDTWGLLWSLPRHQNEGNIAYATRIQETVLAWVGTVPAIQTWLNLFAPGGVITENTGLGYNLTLPAAMTQAQVISFLVSLNRIRPAGVPFSVNQIGLGTYLGTIDFLGDGAMVGDYLSAGTQGIPLPFGPTQLNALILLPLLLLLDPSINPSLV